MDGVAVLGPLQVVANGAERSLGGPRRRGLLSVLVLWSNQVVSNDRLLDAVWGPEAGPGAMRSLRSEISRLRRVLDGVAAVVADGGGYRLEISPERLDVTQFEALISRAASSGLEDPESVVRALDEALGLWRGGPYGEIADSVDSAVGEVRRLEELRIAAMEQRAEVSLLLVGDRPDGLGEVVALLRGLVEEFPLRERLWGLLMIGLYRSGRQADALAAFHEARTVLVERLGLEPSAELAELERQVLTHDQALDPTVPEDTVDPAVGTVGNLPVRAGELVGRDDELAELAAKLADVRLLTVVGPGGVGKTSLAIELARRLEHDFRDGVWIVELASVREPDAVVAAIASALGVHPRGGQALREAVAESLGRGRALVLLDNCEHLVDTVAQEVEELLRSSGVTVLATSRAPLRLSSEHTWTLSPLRTGGENSDASRLFLARARQVRSDLELTEDVAAAARQICRLVDGMPLAVELAAARCRSMSAAEVLVRMTADMGRLLRDTRRDRDQRQRTMEATLRWSFDLLEAPEKELFSQLGVFAGTFDLPAIEAVVEHRDTPVADQLDLLEALADQSMVTLTIDNRGHTRYRLLEPVRQFCEQLTDDSIRLRERHAAYYVAQARTAYDAIWTDTEAESIAQIQADFDNHRLAYQFCADAGDVDNALAIAITLNQYGEQALHHPAGAELLFEAINLPGAADAPLWPFALAQAAWSMARRQIHDGVRPLADQARTLTTNARDRLETLLMAYGTALLLGDVQWAKRVTTEAVELAEAGTDSLLEVRAYLAAAAFEALHGDLDRAHAFLQRVPDKTKSSTLQAVLVVAHIAYAERTGQFDHAVELALETIRTASTAGNRWTQGVVAFRCLPAAVSVLEPSELLHLIAEFLPGWERANDLSRVQSSLLYCAHGLAGLEDNVFACQLLGVEKSLLSSERDRQIHDELLHHFRAVLGRQAVDDLLVQGANTPIRELTEATLEHIAAVQRPSTRQI